MKQETQYTVKVRLPSSEPEILELFGYLIMREDPVKVAVQCSKKHYSHHDAILRGRDVTFELDHWPTPEELEAFAELENRVPAWAVALAERLYEADTEFRTDIKAMRVLSRAQIEALEGEINDLRAAIERVQLIPDPDQAPGRGKTKARST